MNVFCTEYLSTRVPPLTNYSYRLSLNTSSRTSSVEHAIGKEWPDLEPGHSDDSVSHALLDKDAAQGN